MLKRVLAFGSSARAALESQRQIRAQLVQEHFERLRRDHRHNARKESLIPFGCQIYSQGDEDGIISEIFNRIGTTSRTFVEFGIGDGLENNTLALLFRNWSGLWIDANGKSIRRIHEQARRTINRGSLRVLQSFVTRDNINDLISTRFKREEIDLLSIDIDGNDLHVFEAINCISPRVVVIEYNAKFPPPIYFCMDYDQDYAWRGNDCFGASLKALELAAAEKGYRLVGCSLTGANAFFVRSDCAKAGFLEPFTAETHYEPPRYFLIGARAGHIPSFDTLERSLGRRSNLESG